MVERDAEMLRIRSALERAMAQTGSLLVVEGPAGIGKSRLLSEACERASELGLRVLRARGGALERDLAYGAVRQVLERPLASLGEAERVDVLGGAAALAAPALAVAGPEAPAPPDRGFAVDHGLFWCVANLAERGPLLLALDDAHWFDAASLRFVLYLARRVVDLPVALIVATRDDESGPEPLHVAQLSVEPDAEIVRPTPLTPDGVTAVLEQRMAGEVAPEFGAACHAAVAGNPFLLGEMAGALVADGVRPTAEAAPGVAAVRPRTVSRAILLRLGRMPTGAAELATAVAVLGEGANPGPARMLAGLDELTAAKALDRLAEAEILTPTLPLDFVHPLVREAIYGELGSARRADWHARAAELVLAEGGPIERAGPHLLLTTPAGRPETVQALRRAARAALERGASDVATRCLKRALAEPPPDGERAEVLSELGAAGYLAGEHEVGSWVREAIGLIDDSVGRAEAWLLLSWVTYFACGPAGVVAVLEEAMEDLATADDEELRGRMETQLITFGMTHPDTFADAVARVDALIAPPGDTAAERRTLCNLACRSDLTGRSATQSAEWALRALAGGRLVDDEGADSGPVYAVLGALLTADRLDEAGLLVARMIAGARAHGSVWGLASAIGARSFLHHALGDMAATEADGLDALAVPGVSEFDLPFYSAYTAVALVARGARDEAEAILVACACGPALPDTMITNFALWARGRLRIAQGRLPEALGDLLEYGARCERLQLRNPVVPWRADAALVHGLLGERAAADALAGEYDEQARAWGTPRVLGISARTRGLLAGGDLALLGEAVDAHGASPARLEHARSLLELGAALRRAGRRRDALGPLGQAGELAATCGATVLAARADEELVVAGGVGRRYAFSGADALTPSELRVARMAADGLANREIAQTLFVTAKTVENHLGRAYAKLGISSRGELRASLAPAASGVD